MGHQELAFQTRGAPARDDSIPISGRHSWPHFRLPGAARDPGHHDPGISTVAGGITSGRRCTLTPMKCITWNVRGLRNPRRQGVVGRYLKEWGADVICLQETMLASTDHRTWSDLGLGRRSDPGMHQGQWAIGRRLVGVEGVEL